MSDELTIEFAIANAPNARAAEAIRNAAARSDNRKLNPKEATQLASLKRQMAESAVERQMIAKNGGERALAQKQSASNLFSDNIHRGGK